MTLTRKSVIIPFRNNRQWLQKAGASEQIVDGHQNKAMLSARLVFRHLGEHGSPLKADLSHIIPNSLQHHLYTRSIHTNASGYPWKPQLDPILHLLTNVGELTGWL